MKNSLFIIIINLFLSANILTLENIYKKLNINKEVLENIIIPEQKEVQKEIENIERR